MIEREDENNEEETVLKITDKRKFKLDGSLRDGVIIEPEPEKKEVKSEPTRESVISQTESEEAKPPEQQHTSADEEANEDEILGANDPASFINFLSTLVSQAAASLGAMPHPATGQKEVNLEAAKHWINVLSMLKEKTEDSYNQITKFGSLIRATLDYSEKEYIDFEDELKLLETYLSMEKLRFKENFFYIIDKGDVQNIRIPPMLIQPFLENALLHGLLHKEGNKKLSIKFGIEEKVLICLIKDNGIGRKTAQVIRERQQQKHESFAINAIKRRLEILSQQTNTELGIDYTDLTDKNEDSGTLVKLRIPYIRNF